MPPKKILIVNYSDGGGGAARQTYRLYKALNKKLSVFMYVKKKHYNEKKIIKQNALIHLVTKFIEKILKIFLNKNSKDFHSYNLFPTDILDVIKKIRPDLVQLHWIGNNTISLKEISLINVPIVWRLSDMWHMLGSKHYQTKKKEENSLLNFDKYILSLKKKYIKNNISFITPSKWIEFELKKNSLSKKNKSYFIPNIIDTKFWKKNKKSYLKKKIKLNDEIIITFGASYIDDYRKGLNFLIESLKFLKIKYKLIIFGDKISNSIIYKIKKFKNIIYLGKVDADKDLRDIYSLSNLVVIPSIIDNSPNIFFEAIACGTPVIAFKNSGLKFFIDHKKTGWLAEDRNSLELAKGIEWCSNVDNNKLLSKNVIRYCKENFSETIITKKYLQLYKQILNIKKRDHL